MSSGSVIDTAWSEFLAGWEAGDDDACLDALQRWLAAFDDIFWNGDVADLERFYTEDCRLDVHVPILGTSFRGHAGLHEWRAEMLEVIASFRFMPDTFERHGERFAGTGTVAASGRLSGVAPRAPWGVVWSLRDGLIATADAYPGRRALKELRTS